MCCFYILKHWYRGGDKECVRLIKQTGLWVWRHSPSITDAAKLHVKAEDIDKMLPYRHMNNSEVCWGTNNPNVNTEIRRAARLFISLHQSVWGETRDSKKKSLHWSFGWLVLYEASTWWSCRSAYASPHPFLPIVNKLHAACIKLSTEMKCKCSVKARHMTQPIPVFFFFFCLTSSLPALCTLHPHPTPLIGHGADERRHSRGR